LETGVAVIVPFETPGASIEELVALVAPDMERVNATILSRTGSDVTMIPEVANHLISSGGKRLRPMLTLAMANLAGYTGDGHIKLAASVEFMHTATLLHDDVVDESEMRRGQVAARMRCEAASPPSVCSCTYDRCEKSSRLSQTSSCGVS